MVQFVSVFLTPSFLLTVCSPETRFFTVQNSKLVKDSCPIFQDYRRKLVLNRNKYLWRIWVCHDSCSLPYWVCPTCSLPHWVCPTSCSLPYWVCPTSCSLPHWVCPTSCSLPHWVCPTCSLPLVEHSGVSWYVQLYTGKCIPYSERIVCVTLFYYPATWSATHLQRIYFYFWRVDAVM